MTKVQSFSKSLSSHFLRLFYLSYFRHFFNILICILILWTLYGFVIHRGWWTVDDTLILYSTVKNGIFKHFYCPQVWRSISSTNLTPWINLSFGIDWHLFGFHAKGFYVHQLISFSLVLIFCYLAIIEFLPPLVTLIILILFITSRPAACFAEFLWVRHYLEGLGLAALAFWLFIKSTTTKSTWISFLGAIFYGLAMSAKEIYTPLIILLFFFPLEFSDYNRSKQLYYRFKFLIPYIVIAIAYIIWRIYMLSFSHIIRTYLLKTTEHLSLMYLLKKFLLDFIHSMGWSPIETAVIAIIVIGGGILYTHNDLKKLFFLFLWTISITIPILPVLSYLNHNPVPLYNLRILIVFTLSFYIFIGFILKSLLSLPKRLWLVGPIVLFFISINFHILQASNNYQEAIEKYMPYKILGKFMLLPKPDAILVNPPNYNYYFFFLLKKLAVITHQIPTEDSTPKICVDMCLCSQIMRNKKVSWWQYINGQVVPIKKLKSCVIQNNKPLWAKLIYKNGIIKWEFGPYKKGTYFLLRAHKNLPAILYRLPPSQTYYLFLQHSLNFWIRYDSPEGWRTYSPLLHLKPKNNHGEIHYKYPQKGSKN